MIKVIITDDHPVVRSGLKQILEDYSDISVSGEAGNGSELINILLKDNFDVILLDISMPGRNGLDLLKDIKKIDSKISILILSIHPEEQYAIRALKLGASGYLTKNSAPKELVDAIRKVDKGEKYITASLAERIALNTINNLEMPAHDSLSDREMEVMCNLAKGKSIKIISEELSLSSKTISTYRERILEKMNMNTTAEIIRYALKEGLVE
ncbi:MAG: response regulator transcription factor [Bacteroidales bacterium]|nr:response regulator transcription factor [Bacteroidales bacterium]